MDTLPSPRIIQFFSAAIDGEGQFNILSQKQLISFCLLRQDRFQLVEFVN
ncbi:hypothetical protein MGI18_26815 [Bacillus sp. OVS6]|nr:hypothetical protein MGI18_26815 [Bacillus sp. OVS6]